MRLKGYGKPEGLRKPRKHEFRMRLGPLGGTWLKLTTPGTKVFTLNGQTGYYDSNNLWQEMRK